VGDAPEQVLFLVLGSFEVRVDGRTAALGGARQRLVLAGLVAHANAVVSTDRLVDLVWGDEPPDTALTTVQKYVHRLRGSLGDRILTSSASTMGNLTSRASSASSPTPPGSRPRATWRKRWRHSMPGRVHKRDVSGRRTQPHAGRVAPVPRQPHIRAHVPAVPSRRIAHA
jgi:hypothetical protein